MDKYLKPSINIIGNNNRRKLDDIINSDNDITKKYQKMSIKGIEFSIYKSSDIIGSGDFVEITTPSTKSNLDVVSMDQHRLGTPYDSALGTLSNETACTTCHRSASDCIGHLGYIRLLTFIVHPLFVRDVIRVLRCVVHEGPKRGQLIFQRITIDEVKSMNLVGMKRLEEFEIRSRAYYRDNAPVSDMINVAYPEVIDVAGYQRVGYKIKINNKVEYKNWNMVRLESLLNSISDEDAYDIGFDRHHPRDYLISHMMVSPPNARPPVYRAGMVEEHPFTEIYNRVLKLNLDEKLKRNVNRTENEALDSYREAVSKEYKKILIAEPNSNDRDSKASLKEAIKGKEGIIRKKMEASRVNFSARTIMTPDPTLDVNEISIPEEFRDKLTITELIDEENIEYFQELMRTGFVTTVIRNEVKYTTRKSTGLILELGDKVYRYLMEGDWVLINRNPTIHKSSMLALKAKFNSNRTVRIPLAITLPLAGDFDGDELNIHAIQSAEGRRELENILAVNKHIIDFKSSRVQVALTYDDIISSYMLTDGTQWVTLSEITSMTDSFNLLKLVERYFAIKRKVPILSDRVTQIDLNKVEMDNIENVEHIDMSKEELLILLSHLDVSFNGRSIFSMFLPEDFNYDRLGVKIIQGVLLNGNINKTHVGKTQNNIIQVLWKYYSENNVIRFLSDYSHFLSRWFDRIGFSIGLNDCIVLTEEERKEFIESARELIMDKIENLVKLPNHAHPKDIRIYEEKILRIINEVFAPLRDIVKDKIDDVPNRMEMARISGAKGSELNVRQISMNIGQQYLYGKRFNTTLSNNTRAMSYFESDSTLPESRGFCYGSFSSGLSLVEFLFHSAASREGLLDTALVTADIGYLQRRLSKTLLDLQVRRDGTIRNSNDDIVQFVYGSDGFSLNYMQNVNFSGTTMNMYFDPNTLINSMNTQYEIDNNLF